MQNQLKSHSLGYPRIGAQRQLKKALEAYWAGNIGEDELREAGKAIRATGWQRHAQAGIDLIPSNDFSLYDHMLDATTAFGAIPERFLKVQLKPLDTYFAMARGAEGTPACAMTKWFDTNYHYIVPELKKDTTFRLSSNKALDEYREAKALGIQTVPVIVGPVTYLSLAACADVKFDTLDLLSRLQPVYEELLASLRDAGAEYVQLDEPIFSTDLSESQKAGLRSAYEGIAAKVPNLKIIVANYFGRLAGNLPLFASLPVSVLHVDAVRAPEEVAALADAAGKSTILSVGVVEGRNIWKTDLHTARKALGDAAKIAGRDRVWVATSCSLLHVPVTLKSETSLSPELRSRLAFAEEKLDELRTLADGYKADEAPLPRPAPDEAVRERLAKVGEADFCRAMPRKERLAHQRKSLGLPLLPTTTIGSFPQTKEVRANRARWKRGEITTDAYEGFLESAIANCVRFQDEAGLDVLVHGEFERNDMVEYFGEHMKGVAFTENGWVQSYGSRCVKPPVIHSDVSREGPITVRWTRHAQSVTSKPVKGMLTGPVTILKWSFVRNDQPLRDTAFQIALALRDEVHDLEAAGTRIIQIDEPGLREGLPLRSADTAAYLTWAVDAFRLASSGVRSETQIHTHMCYARFDGIIEAVTRLDADVISIEAARSPLERLAVFGPANYGGEVGPGVWDIHSPRVPSVAEMVGKLLDDAKAVGATRLWANPDCGLKTRGWAEVSASLKNLVEAAALARSKLA
jgi:5-methyltetrahydropteroyltriglutamate--homocysteine methyltransferase